MDVWGPGAINLEKLAEEGIPAPSQLLWGLHLDFEAQTVTLPEPKRMKAKYLLREPSLQRGCTQVKVKLLRELAGSAQYWASSAPELVPYLPVFYRPLQQLPGDHGVRSAAGNSTGAARHVGRILGCFGLGQASNGEAVGFKFQGGVWQATPHPRKVGLARHGPEGPIRWR